MKTEKNSRNILAYCTLAGFLSSIAISGLLFSLDFVSKTPPGTFFAVIGSSLGFYDSSISPYIGLLLHFATGTVAGNLLGQGGIFWNRLIPIGLRRGTILGIITGVSLWLVLFFTIDNVYYSTEIRTVQLFCPKSICLCNCSAFSRPKHNCSNRVIFLSYSLWNYFGINSGKTYQTWTLIMLISLSNNITLVNRSGNARRISN